MFFILTISQSFILLILSGIHINWAFGGKWSLDRALPTNEEGKRVLNPTRVDSAIVAIGLLIFATYYLLKANIITLSVPSHMLPYVGWAISSIFMLRAIGDFKYVGFFKRFKTTDFAKLDLKIYSPLSLSISIIGLLIELF